MDTHIPLRASHATESLSFGLVMAALFCCSVGVAGGVALLSGSQDVGLPLASFVIAGIASAFFARWLRPQLFRRLSRGELILRGDHGEIRPSGVRLDLSGFRSVQCGVYSFRPRYNEAAAYLQIDDGRNPITLLCPEGLEAGRAANFATTPKPHFAAEPHRIFVEDLLFLHARWGKLPPGKKP